MSFIGICHFSFFTTKRRRRRKDTRRKEPSDGSVDSGLRFAKLHAKLRRHTSFCKKLFIRRLCWQKLLKSPNGNGRVILKQLFFSQEISSAYSAFLQQEKLLIAVLLSPSCHRWVHARGTAMRSVG